MMKIRSGQQLKPSEMETVSYSSQLRDVYNYRWWNTELESHFVHFNWSSKTVKAGEQAFFCYGSRSDDYLVEQYGFCLGEGENPFSAWKFRVHIGVSPSGEIDDISELIPPQAVIDDHENVDKLTELIAVQRNRPSPSLMEYLRGAMSSHYSETGGEDSEYLMMTCPRVLDFELLIVDWALKLVEKVGKEELLKKRTLAQDRAELARTSDEKL